MKKSENQLTMFDLPQIEQVKNVKSFKNKRQTLNYVEFIKGLPKNVEFKKMKK